MKKLILFLSIILCCVSCHKEDNLYKEPNIDIDNDLLLTNNYEVPITNGKITVVTNGDDTLAIADIPVNINISKYSKINCTCDNKIDVKYIDYKELPKFIEGSYITNEYGIMMFEDTEKHDYDYNDLIIVYNIRRESINCHGETITFLIKPIALGSTKKLAFGYNDRLNRIQYLSMNVREDWFLGKSGFINTEKGTPFKPVIESNGKIEDHGDFKIYRDARYYKKAKEEGGFIMYSSKYINNLTYLNGLKFFIEDQKKEKFYIASRNLNIKGSLPYGLHIPCKSICCYPNERQNIDLVFPHFIDWVNNKNKNYVWHDNPLTDKGYNVSNSKIFYLPNVY